MAERLSGHGSGRGGRGRRRNTPMPEVPTSNGHAVEGSAPEAATDLERSGNLTKATFQEHYIAILQAKKDHAEAVLEAKRLNGILRAERKAAKKAGLDMEAMDEALEKQSQDPQEVQRHVQKVNTYLYWMKFPVGYQIGLFADGETIAAKLENQQTAAARADSDDEAYQAGYAASTEGKGVTTNPYPLESAQFDAFEKGWGKQQSERALSMGGGGAGQASVN